MKLVQAKVDSDSTQTTCPYCGVGCGVELVESNGEVKALKGNAAHPANLGRLCVKGSALDETVSLNGRLLHPELHGRRATWSDALDHVAQKFKAIIEESGPDSVAFYLSGQLLTEDYYVANKLMKGFIGTANVDTNSRLCMSSAVVAHKRAFGADAVPACYEDLEKTDVIIFVGSNAAYNHPVLYQRIVAAKENKPIKIIVLDPRRTATCDIADIHLPLAPGSDAYFFNGLLSYLSEYKKLDHEFIDAHCDGFEEALAAAQEQVSSVEKAALLCDVDVELLRKCYEAFSENKKVITLFSMGINQSSSGVDKGNSIINCHLASGKIGYEGAAPFSITGQPNAMGGREVGGLANQLAAHMAFTEADIDVVKRFWSAPRMATENGKNAVAMFDDIHSGKIRAVWIMATNPVVSLPNADKVKEALDKCELVVVSDVVNDSDSAKCADVLFPAAAWGEKHGTVTNSERTISLQKAFLPLPGEAKPDWKILCEFAGKLGYGSAFAFDHPYEIFREHAALSGFERESSFARAFDISALKNISFQDYENFEPRQWPLNESFPRGKKRLFEDGKFYTANGKAKLIPIAARLPQAKVAAEGYVLNTGRVRDQWHTMTRTGKVPKLMTHSSEPFIEIHPDDAAQKGIKAGDLIRCDSQYGVYIGRAIFSSGQRRKEVFCANALEFRILFNGQGGSAHCAQCRSVQRAARI